MSKVDSTPLTSLPKKWDKLLKNMPEYKETADSASVDDLKKIIVECEGNLYTISKDKELDTKLSAAREMSKDLAGPYKDAILHQQCKIQYALLCLESKGVELDNKE